MTLWPTHVRRLAAISLFRSQRVHANHGRVIRPLREEIEFLIHGRAFFDHDGRDVELGPGAILWHQSGAMTVRRTDPNAPYHCVVFAFDVVRAPSPAPPRLTLATDPAEARAFALSLHDAYHRGDGDRSVLAAYAYTALHWRVQRDGAGPDDPLLPPAVRLASACINRRFAEPLTVADVAAAAGLRPSQLHVLFRRWLKTTPWQALADRRLAEARRLLSAGDVPAQDIGHAVGWSDPAHFGRVFRARVGLSPGGYRRRYRLTNT